MANTVIEEIRRLDKKAVLYSKIAISFAVFSILCATLATILWFLK